LTPLHRFRSLVAGTDLVQKRERPGAGAGHTCPGQSPGTPCGAPVVRGWDRGNATTVRATAQGTSARSVGAEDRRRVP
jgi:hypothetical protein